ncbi:hypothetical protein ACSS6W_001975 [Trichoderma asperelloides]
MEWTLTFVISHRITASWRPVPKERDPAYHASTAKEKKRRNKTSTTALIVYLHTASPLHESSHCW